MQWCIDFFFLVIYKIICLFLYLIFNYIFWPPFYSFFWCYLEFKRIGLKVLKVVHFEFFERRPTLFIIEVLTFIILAFVNILFALPRGLYCELIKNPSIKKYYMWSRLYPDRSKIVRNYFLEKKGIALYIFSSTRDFIFSKYLFVKIWNLDFFYHDVFLNKDIIYAHFVIVRTILAKIVLLYFLFSRNYLDCVHNHLFFNEPLLSFNAVKSIRGYSYWNFDSVSVYLNICTSMTHPNLLHFILVVLFSIVFFKKIFFNFNELLVFLNLEWSSKYFNYINNREYFVDYYKYQEDAARCYSYIRSHAHATPHQLQDFYCNYSDTAFFFFPGLLFFSTVLISWLFFSFLGLYGIFQFNLMSLSFFWLSLLFYVKPIFLQNKVYEVKIANWLYLNNNIISDYYFLIDSISFSFILLTTTIALFVYIYAFSYFRYEPLVDRFLLFLLSFVVSMLFLVSSGNLIMLFLGWELIGLTSFFLINFWSTKTATLKSAFKAFSFNKLSDFFLFIFIIGVYNIYYTTDISILNQLVYKNQNTFIYFSGISMNSLEFLSLMLLAASFIKSAQIGGHIWLPDSMEAPVPASALIHSATLVSAGVYLILRFNFLFDYAHFPKIILPLVGSITAAYGGVCASTQTDLKKTLAYSTISHCGFLMVLCATEVNEFVVLYLYTHGCFKAILFMCIGNVLRISNGYQDSRRMGGLFKYLPFEYFCSLICVFNLAGLPFTFGFFAKHLLFLNLTEHMYVYYIVLFNSLVGAIAGLLYSYNLLQSVFMDFKKGDKSLYSHLSNKRVFSVFYTNSSTAAIISIASLLSFSYCLIFFLYTNMLAANFLLSDYMTIMVMNNYYSFLNASYGFNLNYFYMNVAAIVVIMHVTLKKKKKSVYAHTQFKLLFSSLFAIFFITLFLY